MVTIIIPTYNRMSYLEWAIDSVLGQIYRQFSLIVVDDGSTDGTADLVRGLRDPEKVEYMRFPHSGFPGKVRNAGICPQSCAFPPIHRAKGLPSAHKGVV